MAHAAAERVRVISTSLSQRGHGLRVREPSELRRQRSSRPPTTAHKHHTPIAPTAPAPAAITPTGTAAAAPPALPVSPVRGSGGDGGGGGGAAPSSLSRRLGTAQQMARAESFLAPTSPIQVVQEATSRGGSVGGGSSSLELTGASAEAAMALRKSLGDHLMGKLPVAVQQTQSLRSLHCDGDDTAVIKEGFLFKQVRCRCVV